MLRRRCELTSLTTGVRGIAADPDDDHVLDAAASSQSTRLVTGDRALQELAFYRDVAIVSPWTLLDLLLAEEPSSSGPER